MIDFRKRLAKEQGSENTDMDSISIEDFTSNKVEEYETYKVLGDFIYQVLNVNDKNKKTLTEIMEDLVDIEDEAEFEEALEFVGHKVITLLEYVGVSKSAIDDLLDDDDDVSVSEMIALAEMLADKVDGDIRKFVVKALNEVTEDDVNMDNTFYESSATCKHGRGENKVSKKNTLKCVEGYSNGKKGFWRLPKNAEKRKNGDNKATPGEKAHLKKLHTKMHKSEAELKRKKSMKARKKKGMTVFSGYVNGGSKRSSTANI